MADTELLPCPFCGSPDVKIYLCEYGGHSALCGKCEAEGPRVDSEEEAGPAWNIRAALASRPAEVDDEGLPPLPEPFANWDPRYQGLELPVFTAEQFRQGQRDAVAAHKMAESFCEANCCWSGHHAECFRSKQVVAPSHTTNKEK